jgi:hypothetical protein
MKLWDATGAVRSKRKDISVTLWHLPRVIMLPLYGAISIMKQALLNLNTILDAGQAGFCSLLIIWWGAKCVNMT